MKIGDKFLIKVMRSPWVSFEQPQGSVYPTYEEWTVTGYTYGSITATNPSQELPTVFRKDQVHKWIVLDGVKIKECVLYCKE